MCGEESDRGLHIGNKTNEQKQIAVTRNFQMKSGGLEGFGQQGLVGRQRPACSEPLPFRCQRGGQVGLPKRRAGEDKAAEGLGGGEQSKPGQGRGLSARIAAERVGAGVTAVSSGRLALSGSEGSAEDMFYTFVRVERSWDS